MADIFKVNHIKTHLILSFSVRLLLIAYGEIQDKISVVQYTDIDYRVFTDAARHVLNGNSPYNRHTYRYSPIIAALLVPNIILHDCWGKIIFSLLDVVAGFLVYKLAIVQGVSSVIAGQCAMTWLYNPLGIIIATRGNADAISAVLVLLTLFLIQKQDKVILTGITHAIAIHVRLYPLVFSLPLYLSLKRDQQRLSLLSRMRQSRNGLELLKTTKQILSFLYPNKYQLYLVVSCVTTLFFLTAVCYMLYGYQFLHESVLYHLSRRDIRHNFSVYFYMLYLSSTSPPACWQRVLIFLPQAMLLIAVSFIYSSRPDLPFCFFIQAIIMVTYNPVVTSQYFVWFLSLLPPCIPFIALSKAQAGALVSLWFAAQISWLLPAYLLEFRGRETFMYIWLQGMAFFCVNIAILARLVKAYQSQKMKVS